MAPDRTRRNFGFAFGGDAATMPLAIARFGVPDGAARRIPHATTRSCRMSAATKPDRRLFARAVGLWAVILLGAFANGLLREVVLAPAFGRPLAEVLSALLLAAVVVAVAWWLVRRGDRRPLSSWLLAGVLWVVLTAAFEFGFFHRVMGEPLEVLLATYDPRYGYFGLIQLVVLLAPAAWALRLRRTTRPARELTR